MSQGNILIILTSQETMGEGGERTGFHYEELTTPYCAFQEADYEVTLASIKGGHPPHDPDSLKDGIDANPPSVCAFIADDASKHALHHTHAIEDVKAGDFDAVYLPGGHGTMWDFPENDRLAALIGAFFRAKKPVAAVCHGPAGLLKAEDEHGEPIVKDRRVNCFTNAEEKQIGKDDVVPFLLETALRERGARFECADPFEPYVAEDGHLITGQNPASAKGVAKAVLRRLK